MVDEAQTTGLLIVLVASAGYFLAWLILALHDEVIRFKPRPQRRIKSALRVLLVVDGLAGILIRARAEPGTISELGVIGALPYYVGALTLVGLMLCELDKAEPGAILPRRITRGLLWAALIPCSLIALPACGPALMAGGFVLLSFLLLFMLAVTLVVSTFARDYRGRPDEAEARATILYRLFLRMDAAAIFLVANLILWGFMVFPWGD